MEKGDEIMSEKKTVWWQALMLDCLQAICIGGIFLIVLFFFSLISFACWIKGDGKEW